MHAQAVSATSQVYACVLCSIIVFGNAVARSLGNHEVLRFGNRATTQGEKRTQTNYTEEVATCSAIRFGNAAALRCGNTTPKLFNNGVTSYGSEGYFG